MKGPGKHYPLTQEVEIRKLLEGAIALYKASLKWYWRLLAGIIALATLISAAFQVLSYLRS